MNETLYNLRNFNEINVGDKIDVEYCGRHIVGIVADKRYSTCLKRNIAGKHLRHSQTEIVVAIETN